MLATAGPPGTYYMQMNWITDTPCRGSLRRLLISAFFAPSPSPRRWRLPRSRQPPRRPWYRRATRLTISLCRRPRTPPNWASAFSARCDCSPRARRSIAITCASFFYGQSITEQDWSKQVAADLSKRFPNADLDIRNLAIGGFASQLLIRTVDFDVYPFYPDLVIFHVYGADEQYEQIIRDIRSRTTAEVLMQKDHATHWPSPDRSAARSNWDNYMNQHFLPATAKKYGCGLADVRGEWVEYLRANHLSPKDLLIDGVHLNASGNYLMAGIIEQYLVYRPDLPDPSAKTVQAIAITPAMIQPDGHIKIDFTGNRIDALPAARAAPAAMAKVLIDGKSPSAFPELYTFMRPAPAHGRRCSSSTSITISRWWRSTGHIR